jgi:nitroreductase/NAD-dependent dihydropyrimidine dehydrogenase PreA subunit
MVFSPEQSFESVKCTACGICSQVCPEDSIRTDESGLVISFESTCIGCGHCGCYCPSNCFSLPEENRGLIPEQEQLQNLFESRRSVRHFLEKPVEETVIRSLLEPVGFSPTGQNAQGITVEVILGRGRIRKLVVDPLVKLIRILDCFRLLSLFAGKSRAAVKKIRNGEDIITWKAPCVLLFRAPAGNITGKTDAVIAATMVSVKAEAMGLGTFWNGVVQVASVFLRVKKSHAVLCVGYPMLKKYQRVPARDWVLSYGRQGRSS